MTDPVEDHPDDLAEAEALLWRPLEIYRPFAADEAELLRTFSTNVHKLRTYSFFQQVPSQLRVFGRQGEPTQSQMQEPSDEATRAAAALFRQVYWHREPANFGKVMKCLKLSVNERNSEHRDQAMAILSEIHGGQRVLLERGAGIGLYHSSFSQRKRLTTEDILATYLHGVYLHGGNDKSRRAEALDRAPRFARFTFYTAIFTLTRLYLDAATIADAVLAEPELLFDA